MNIKEYMADVGARARASATVIAATQSLQKNAALLAIASSLDERRDELVAANKKDMAQGISDGLAAALLDRLSLDDKAIDQMIVGLSQVANLPDPCGEITDLSYRPSGIQVGKMRVPLGVVGIIYESRPNVTIDAASLCLKSGNAAILRGGKEALNSNKAISACIKTGLKKVGLPKDIIQVISTADRAVVGELITMNEFVDVIVPRGGKGLIERIVNQATVLSLIQSDAADDLPCVDLGGRRIIKKKNICNSLHISTAHSHAVTITQTLSC